jgi:peptidoglycan hydrolase-like protein with peptidoglycan-binding domain
VGKKRELGVIVCLTVLLLLCTSAYAQVQFQRQVPGPSFPCPTPRDPLAQLICDTPELSRFDLVFVQTYQALRQQLADPLLQQSLRKETLDFGRAVRFSCGIALAQSENSNLPPPPPAPSGASFCVLQAYQRQRTMWASRLTGAAAEEAARSIERQVMLQNALTRLKYLSATESFDGVFGTLTRSAITSWQLATGREATGLLGNTDAQGLMQAASDYVATNNDPQPLPSLEDQKAAAVQREIKRQDLVVRRQNLAAKYGDVADAIIAGIAQIGMTPEMVIEARGTPIKKITLPPNYEIWVYNQYRVAFTDGKVTHVGQ